jgi:hypothetical protein
MPLEEPRSCSKQLLNAAGFLLVVQALSQSGLPELANEQMAFATIWHLVSPHARRFLPDSHRHCCCIATAQQPWAAWVWEVCLLPYGGLTVASAALSLSPMPSTGLRRCSACGAVAWCSHDRQRQQSPVTNMWHVFVRHAADMFCFSTVDEGM